MAGEAFASPDSDTPAGGKVIGAATSPEGILAFAPKRLIRGAVLPVCIFALVFVAYYSLSHQPSALFAHHVYQAKAFLHGNLDLTETGIPGFYHDVVVEDGKTYFTLPPVPALLLVPFVAIGAGDFSQARLWGVDFSVEALNAPFGIQAHIAVALGAVNVVLAWHMLGLLKVSRFSRLLLTSFFAFGTVHFFAATSGTMWLYAQVVAVFFLFLSILSLLHRAPPLIPAILLGFAFLSREPTMFAAPAFGYWYWRQRHQSLCELFTREGLLDRESIRKIGMFAAGCLPFVIFWFWYNHARFGGIFETGYDVIYEGYLTTNNYSFYRGSFPDAPHFNLFDIRNIPLHLYTIFLMPPQFTPDWGVFRPSPYGLSVLITSPAFVYATLVRRTDPLRLFSWLAIGCVSIPLLLHFSQGWVQFGYRFLLDFVPFLLILTAFGFDDNASPAGKRMQVMLVAVSIVAGFWGRYWATKFGW